jgi:TolB-like protein
MDQERWQRVQELFEAAGALVPEERAAYLEGACSGDDELRREVMALLGRERVPGDPLGDAVAEAAADAVRTGPTSLAAGHRIGRYTILDKLGVGGMGEVYLAEDRELGRQVALKLLGSWIAADERQVRRFQREARALATLSHPNIVTIFSVEHEGDAHFLTMESVRGRRLDQAIGAGEVGLEGFFDIAVPLSAALAAAHRQGITHRDLKPANVMLTAAGEVKVLDFGLAKLKPAATSRAQTVALSATLTRAGVVVGTVPYMSPEQVEGKPVDERSDIFSLGVVFYEMVTGGRPFRGDSEAALISSILTQEPPGIATVDSRVPPRLARIIGRCLAKQPQARYQSATDLLAELEEVADSVESHPKISRGLGWLAALALRVRRWRLALAAAAVLALAAILVSVDFGGPQVDSLAVLPFASLNRDGQQEYLADGMTEVLITELSKIGGLKVISRTSVMPMKDTDLSMTQIAERLGVDAVVEGSVRRSEDRIGVTAKLFHAASGEPLWAESFERDLRDLLALQGELARAIAHQIEVTLTPEEQERLTNREAVDPRAWEAYLRGRNRWRQFSLEEALGEFRQAAEIDPEFALAHAGVATILQMQGAIGFPHPPRVSYPAAREAAARALELEPRLAEAHAVQGWIALNFDFDWPAAAREFGRARELGPGSVDAQRGDWSFVARSSTSPGCTIAPCSSSESVSTRALCRPCGRRSASCRRRATPRARRGLP